MTYKKEIDGKSVIKRLKDIVIKKNGMQIFNPSEEMVLEDGWVEYVAPVYEPTEAELLENARLNKLNELYSYDSSEKINNCIIVYNNEKIRYWANKHERDALKSALQDCIAIGRTVYRLDLRDKGVTINISCEKLLQMLAILEVYAIDCFNKTTDHEFILKSLETIDEIEAYEFKDGYPDAPQFEI